MPRKKPMTKKEVTKRGIAVQRQVFNKKVKKSDKLAEERSPETKRSRKDPMYEDARKRRIAGDKRYGSRVALNEAVDARMEAEKNLRKRTRTKSAEMQRKTKRDPFPIRNTR